MAPPRPACLSRRATCQPQATHQRRRSTQRRFPRTRTQRWRLCPRYRAIPPATILPNCVARAMAYVGMAMGLPLPGNGRDRVTSPQISLNGGVRFRGKPCAMVTSSPPSRLVRQVPACRRSRISGPRGSRRWHNTCATWPGRHSRRPALPRNLQPCDAPDPPRAAPRRASTSKPTKPPAPGNRTTVARGRGPNALTASSSPKP